MENKDIKLSASVLLNVLKSVGNGNEYHASPNTAYLEAMEELGLIKMGWDNTLTPFGQYMLEKLSNDLNY